MAIIRLLSVVMTISIFMQGCASATSTDERSFRALNTFLDRIERVEGSSPGLVVVVANGHRTTYIHANGVLNVDTGAQVTADSPFYIASMTKAYVGLLAARLHDEGILDLETTLTDYWPDTAIQGVNMSQITLRDLLTHRVPFNVDMITFLESYVTDIPASKYPQFLSRFGEAREPGFEYDNLGYNIYAAILQQATGHDWRYWLREKVLDPLDLDDTASLTSVFPIDDMAWRHQWKGGTEWYALPPKSDPQMQSAGGMMTSARDLGAWLTANIRERNEPVFRAAQTPYVDTLGDGDSELVCDGYTLGWNECSFHGVRVLQHGGGYVGARSFMAVAPEAGIGVGVMANSDNMMGYMSKQIAEFYLAHAVGAPWSRERIDRTLLSYASKMHKLLAGRTQRMESDRARKDWAGWSWKPAPEDQALYAGIYVNDDLGSVVIHATDHGLVWQLAGWHASMLPAVPDRFGVPFAPSEGLQQIDFARDDHGQIVSLRWDAFSFRRVND